MSEVNTGSEEPKKGKPKKQNLRVDFTPMVDMNMLLITFFMFCTTLSKPQMMTLVMPTKDKVEEDQSTKIPKEQTVTLILGEKNTCYYYFGDPNYADYTSLKETTYAAKGGLRDMLLNNDYYNNRKLANSMQDLRNQKDKGIISQKDFDDKSKELKNDKTGLVVVIKPTPGATFDNLVNVLDEMQICAVGRYAIVDLTDGDKFLVQNYMEKGALSAQAGKIKK